MGVIVETRNHKDLAFVIDNFIQLSGLRVQLYHGTKNLEFILNSNIKKHINNGNVFLTNLGIEALTAPFYNALFLTEAFWLSIYGKNKIIVFQTDSLICSTSEYHLDNFHHFDYIGARWNKRQRRNGFILNGGTGGFSLRDYTKSLEVIKRFSISTQWEGGEDDYFAFHIELLGGRVGKKSDCDKFCPQKRFNKKSFAAHNINDMDEKTRQKFLAYCPEAKFMIKNKFNLMKVL